MMYLVCQPEIAYLKKDGKLLHTWEAPGGLVFAFKVVEFEDSCTLAEVLTHIQVVASVVYMTKKERDKYKKYRRKG